MTGINVKVQTDTYGGTDKSWIRTRMGLEDMLPIMVKVSAFADNHVKDKRIPSGTALGKITASTTNQYGPYDDAATDGTGVLAGHLFEDVSVDTVDGTTAGASDVGAALYWRGVVVQAKLPVFTGVTSGMVDNNGKPDVDKLIRYVTL